MRIGSKLRQWIVDSYLAAPRTMHRTWREAAQPGALRSGARRMSWWHWLALVVLTAVVVYVGEFLIPRMAR